MVRAFGVVVLAFLLGACATTDNCGKSLCGCSTAASHLVTLRLTDADGIPVPKARLICHDDATFLGETDAEGMLTLQVAGGNTPGCGFMPDCQVAYFRTDSDSFGRHFWFARFVRGEDVSAKAQSVELVDRER